MQHFYPTYYGQGQAQPAPYVQMGKLGAVVGVCGAGALNLRRVRTAEIDSGEAVVDTFRAGLASGLASAAAALVAGQFRSPALSLLATVATGTAVMYALTAEKSSNPNGESE